MKTQVGLVLLALFSSSALAQHKPAQTPPVKPVDPTPAPIKPVEPAPAKPPEKNRVRVNLPVIEILDPSGTMTAPFVRSAVAKIEPEILKCADSAKWANTAFAWIVTDWRGKVTKLELAVDSAAVEKCLATALKAMVVQQSQVRATAFVKLVVGVPPSDDPMHTLQ